VVFYSNGHSEFKPLRVLQTDRGSRQALEALANSAAGREQVKGALEAGRIRIRPGPPAVGPHPWTTSVDPWQASVRAPRSRSINPMRLDSAIL
jgi:hypothetical protein